MRRKTTGQRTLPKQQTAAKVAVGPTRYQQMLIEQCAGIKITRRIRRHANQH